MILDDRTEENIKKYFRNFISARGGKMSEWCVGVTNKVFEEHSANSRHNTDKIDPAIARSIEKYFTELGLDNVTKNSDNPCFVYIFQKK